MKEGNSHDNPCSPGACQGNDTIHVSTGACRTIQSAVDCIPNSTTTRTTILIPSGVYDEQVNIPREKGPVTLLGLSSVQDGVTIAAKQECGGGNASDPCGTLHVGSDDFIMSNITLWNEPYLTAGKTFALEISGDRAGIYNTRIMGKDDVVFTGTQRVYFHKCWINGSTDFNFGQGSAVYDDCTIVAEPGQYWSFITAHAGNVSNSSTPTAYLIQNSQLPYPGPPARIGTTFLGRPWGPLCRVVYKNVWMDKHIDPSGWASRRGMPLNNVFVAEFNSTGPGANPKSRVPWSKQLSPNEAEQWTPDTVLRGWVPSKPELPA
eukprot:m.348063 g.348063  ORF g.348063 m.348063 type:complete len:320 (-) comp35398_c0_seq1:60-1019(-)